MLCCENEQSIIPNLVYSWPHLAELCRVLAILLKFVSVLQEVHRRRAELEKQLATQ